MRRLFYPVCDRNMANFKYSFDPPKAISFQIQLYYFLSDMFWVAALAYRVVAPTFFAQLSLSFIIESAFYSFFAPTFRAFKFFFHAFILHCVLSFCNANLKMFLNAVFHVNKSVNIIIGSRIQILKSVPCTKIVFFSLAFRSTKNRRSCRRISSSQEVSFEP